MTRDPWSREIAEGAMQLRQLRLGPAAAVWIRDLRPRVPCRAHRSSDGGACKNFAMKGSVTCHAHGSRALQVRRAALDRLADAATEALAAKAVYRLGIWPKEDAQAAAMAAAREVQRD